MSVAAIQLSVMLFKCVWVFFFFLHALQCFIYCVKLVANLRCTAWAARLSALVSNVFSD